MNNFRYKLAQFFTGRTGVDAIGRFCTSLALILMVVTMITHWNVTYILADILLIYSIYRMLSRNYQKHYAQNQKFLAATYGIRSFFSKVIGKLKASIGRARYNYNQRKIYRIFRCPSCRQKLRAPKGRGKIMVTCNSCKTQFIKKV